MYTLSIILNLHREGTLAEKTIQNLQHILQQGHSWKDIEVLAILDNPDALTKEILYKYKEVFHQIEEVDFKDLAYARNHGVSMATKNFIVFSDGDDYTSLNLLESLYMTFSKHYNPLVSTAEALMGLDENQHIAVFPEYLIEFPALFQMKYCGSNDFIVQNNRFTHCYHSKIAIFRNLLIKNKIFSNDTPYGYEDWDLNNRLLANGVRYKLANYKLYYRKSNSQSLLANQLSNKDIVRNSSLYAYGVSRHSIEEKEDRFLTSSEEPKLQKKRGVMYRALAKSNIARKIYHLLKNSIKKQPIDIELFEGDKVFLESYGEVISYRQDIRLASTDYFASQLSIQSQIYNQLLEFMQEKEVVYFFPWIGLGGADKVSVEYTKALSTKKSCVITSISSGARIESVKVPHLDLPSGLKGWDTLSEDEQLHILVKAIINSDIRLVHVVNSDIALRSIKYYDEVYKEFGVKTIVTLFCPDYDWKNDAYHGYPVMYPELFEKADLILSDNHYWYDFFKELNKNRDFRYEKLSSPTQKMEISYQQKEENSKKILWASRICNQKLFGIFEEIVNQLPTYKFIIYGSTPEEKNNQKILNRLLKKENVEFRGEYQHIREIDLNEFDLYLFTSLFEGIPTIILDMVMSGIPIVSADVGGISEVLGQNYPLLVKNQSQASNYISKIELYYENKDTIIPKMLEVRDFVLDNHHETTFQLRYNAFVKDLLDDHR